MVGSLSLLVILVHEPVKFIIMTEEANRSAGPDVRQMGGACTSAQLRNITLCSQLNEVHRSLMNLLPRLPAQANANLRCAEDHVASATSTKPAALCVVQ